MCRNHPSRFDGTMFSLWKMQITAYLEYKGLLEVVEKPVAGIPQHGLKLSSGRSGIFGLPVVAEEKAPAGNPFNPAEQEKIKKRC